VADSRYVPRDYALEPLHFGSLRNRAHWRDDCTSDADLDRLRAARVQHGYSYRIRLAIRSSKFETAKAFAEGHGLNYARFSRMLRGEIVMRFEDVATAERLLPGVFEYRVSRDVAFPESY
jgi:hypothetical protein